MGLYSRRTAWFVAPALAMLGAGLLLLGVQQRAGAVDVPVGVSNFQFTPNSVNVQVGDRVHFNPVSGIHGVAFVGFDTPILDLAPGNRTTNAFTEEGTFYYYCTVHSNAGEANEFYLQQGLYMVGKVVVGAGDPAPTSTATATPTATATEGPSPTPEPTVALDFDSVVPGVARE